MPISIPTSSSDVLNMASHTAVGRRVMEEREEVMDAVASEATPLLAKTDDPQDAAHDPDGAEDLATMVIAWQELKHIISLAVYSLGSQVFEHSIVIVPIISLGHLSLQALAATTLATLVITITGFSVLGGLAGALDTVLPHAYASENKKLVGLWCQRMGVVLLVATIPILVIWNNARYIFVALHQEPEIVELAATYLHVYSFGLPAYAFNLISRRYLEVQGLASAQAKIVSTAGTINMFLNYVLVYGPKHVQLGFIGAPLSSVISYHLIALLSVFYGMFKMNRETWTKPWAKEVRHQLKVDREAYGSLLKKGVQGIGHSAAKNWANDIVGFSVALLGPIALGTQSVLISTASIFSQVWIGLGNITTARIEHLLRHKKPRRARIGTSLAIVIAVIVSLITMLIVLAVRDLLPLLFTSNNEVGVMVIAVLPLMCIVHILDSTVHIAGGVLRGTGDQHHLSLINVSGFYIFGLPLGIYLAFRHKLGISGLWMGNLVALAYACILGTWMCARMDWQGAMDRAGERHAESEKWVVGTQPTREENGESSGLAGQVGEVRV